MYTMTLDEALAEAAARGKARGEDAASTWDGVSEAPCFLSGEWAGESIPELLGDVLDSRLEEDYAAICAAYEVAADEAFYSEVTP